MLPYPRSWFDAWVDSAYGPGGFWRTNRPGSHFRTAASSSPLMARSVVALLDRRPEIGRVVDLGAGDGQLLGQLSRLRPGLDLAGVDLRARPPELPAEVGWVQDVWDVRAGGWTTGRAEDLVSVARPTLVVCTEWLDDLPCPVVLVGPSGWHEVVVDDAGNERAGEPLTGEDQAWASRWWPTGRRAEIGVTRDRAWAWAATAAARTGGCALLVDYGHLAARRPRTGSLAAYRDGRLVPPVPSGVNLTAHVAVDAVRAAGEAAGLRTVCCAPQRRLVPAPTPSAVEDPLTDLVRRSEHAALTSPRRWGSHWWLVQSA